MNEFEININGIDRIAHIITRLKLENTGIEYIYYNVDGEKNDNDDYLVFASRIKVNEDGTDVIVEIESADEMKVAFELFSNVYKTIKK